MSLIVQVSHNAMSVPRQHLFMSLSPLMSCHTISLFEKMSTQLFCTLNDQI